MGKRRSPIDKITGRKDGVIKTFLRRICPVIGDPVEKLYRQVYREGISNNIDDKELLRIVRRGEASRELLIGDEYNKNCFRRLQALLPDHIAGSGIPPERRLETRAIVINTLERVKEMLLLNIFYGEEASDKISEREKEKLQGTKS